MRLCTFLGCGGWHPRLFIQSLFSLLYFICMTLPAQVWYILEKVSQALRSLISWFWYIRHEIQLSNNTVAVKCSPFALTESVHVIHITYYFTVSHWLYLCMLWEVTLPLKTWFYLSQFNNSYSECFPKMYISIWKEFLGN